jgi:transcription initiation factor TFIIIB Brf1 subunit/transcription initiation factor TFIIB
MQYNETPMTCQKCGELFFVSGGETGPMIDREEIICPHCGAVCGSDRIADVFRTRKPTPEEARKRLAGGQGNRNGG